MKRTKMVLLDIQIIAEKKEEYSITGTKKNHLRGVICMTNPTPTLLKLFS